MEKWARVSLNNSPRIQYIARSLSFVPSPKMLVILCALLSLV